MGIFSQTITLLAPSGDAVEALEAVVDTGANLTVVPVPLLERLGVEAERVNSNQIGEWRHRRGLARHRQSTVEWG